MPPADGPTRTTADLSDLEHALVETICMTTDRDPHSGDWTLYDHVDADALRNLLKHGDSPMHTSFDADGATVTVEANPDGTVGIAVTPH